MNTFSRLSRSALSVALILSSASLAQAQAQLAQQDQAPRAMTPQEQQDAQSTYVQVVSDDSELMNSAKKIIGNAEALQSRIESTLNATVEMEMPNGQKEPVPRWKKEIAKLRMSVPIDLGVDLMKYLRTNVGFERMVEPTNVAGQQLRTDTYSFKLSSTETAISAKAIVRITFAKTFDGANAKKDALLSRVKWINQVPRDSKEVLQKVGVGETVRIEIEGDLGLVPHFEKIEHQLKAFGSIGVEKKGLFLAEFYRQSEKDLITRFMGVINNGSLAINGGIKQSLIGRILSGALGNAFSIGLDFSFSSSDVIFKDHPTDTMMVIYRFNTQSPEAMDALEQIFQNIKKLAFLRIFNPVKDNLELPQELLKQASKAEKIALADASKSDGQKRIDHEFRGRMTTTFYQIKLGGHASVAASGEDRSGGSRTYVSKYNQDNQVEYYILENFNSQSKGDAGYNWISTKQNHNLDMLLTSNKDKAVGKFLNLVNRNEWQQGTMSSSDIQKIRTKSQLGVPQSISKNPKFQSVFPQNGTYNSASFVMETILGPEALEALRGQSANSIAVALQRFVEVHPERYMMGLPDLYANNGNQSEGDFLETKGTQIRDFLDEKNVNNQAKMFNRMKKEIFVQRWVLGEFIPSIVPSAVAEDVMSVNVRISSDELGVVAPGQIGKATVSDVYKAVKLMRRVLEEDGDFKIRLDEIADQGNK